MDETKKIGCPVRMRTPWNTVVACQLEHGHEGHCLDLDGNALTLVPLAPELRAELARANSLRELDALYEANARAAALLDLD